jgi:hypothetical protein
MPDQKIPAEDKAHDVLAAEAYAMPAPDPALRHGPIALPEDPRGIVDPHDDLAPEESARPAPSRPPAPAGALALARRARPSMPLALAGLLALVAFAVLTRRRR